MATRERTAAGLAGTPGSAGSASARPLSRLLSATGTTTFRIAALSLAAFVTAAAVIFSLLFLRTNEALTELTLSAVRADAEQIAADPRLKTLPALAEAIAVRAGLPGPSLYLLTDGKGAPIAGNLPRLPQQLANVPAGGAFRYVPAGGGPDRLGVAIGLDAGDGARLWVGRDVEEQRVFASRVRNAFLIGFGFLSLVGLAGGIAISRLLLNRIESINETARSIMSGDLTQRVAETGADDELDGLARNLNAMLARIELLMGSLREVSDNIAHDLKTPLNRLRNRAEAALADTRGSQAYREGLERTIEQADDIIRTFNALLLIARLEAGAIEENMETVDLGQLVADCAELYEPVAQERGLALSVSTGTGPRVRANRHLLGQAVVNLVDNAIKYSAVAGAATPGAAVTVTVGQAASGPEVIVGDRGPGISAEDRTRVLKRFVRLEKSRTEPGTGLGLSLVAAVARLHGGSLRLEDNAPGLRAILSLPQGIIRNDMQSGLALS